MFWFVRHGDGIGAAIINREGKVLLIKRRNVPIIANPGIWSFLFGGREKGESHLQTAYREIREETGLAKRDLKLLGRPMVVQLFERKKPSVRWHNHFYIFLAKKSQIRLSWENARWRWADPRDILNDREYSNLFCNKSTVEKRIREALGKLAG